MIHGILPCTNEKKKIRNGQSDSILGKLLKMHRVMEVDKERSEENKHVADKIWHNKITQMECH